MTAYLITGRAGVGKSAVAKELRYYAVGIDSTRSINVIANEILAHVGQH